jgi:O-succinylbenzoate synthase
MRLERAELRLIELRLVQPFETSFGREEKRPALIVALYSEGAVGWGECVASSGPWYSSETVTTAWHVLEEFLLPRVLRQELAGPAALWERLRPIRGHNMAKAALEMAFWDLWAKLEEVPLARLLGGAKERDPKRGLPRDQGHGPPELLEEIARRLEEGYPGSSSRSSPAGTSRSWSRSGPSSRR